MKIGIKLADIKKGGKFENQWYDHIIATDVKVERKGDRMYSDFKDADIPFSWVLANIDDVDIVNASIFAETPISFLTQDVPDWLAKNKWYEEDGTEHTHTFASWGDSSGADTENMISRKSLDGTKMVVDLTNASNNQYDAAFIAQVDGVAGTTPMTVDEARVLTKSAAYQVPE